MDLLNSTTAAVVVNVSYANGAYPLEGALVTVLQKSGEGIEIISVSTTDENGKSRPATVTAPKGSLSQAPFPSALPYTKVTVDVSKEGFYPAQFVDLPVFAGVVSVQNVNLIPRPAFYKNNFYDETVYNESEGFDL